MPRTTGSAAVTVESRHPAGLVVSGRRMLAVFAAAWVLISSLTVLWALATPIAAAPDEPAHLIKGASVALGQFVGSERGPDGIVVQVPQYIAWTHAQTCTAMNDDVDGSCLIPVPGDPSEIVDSTTTAGLYNPVYYMLTGWPSLMFDDSSGVYAMRIVSALLTSAFLALSVMLVSTWRNRTLPLIALGTAITPMVLFLSGTVNPNPLEIAATLAAFAGVMSVVTQPNPRMLTHRVVIVGVSAVLAATMRSLSPLWLAVALLAPFLLANRAEIVAFVKSRAIQTVVVATAVSVVFSLIWVVLSGAITPRIDDEGALIAVPYQGASPFTGFALMLAQFGGQVREMIAIFGWMDTSAPVEVYAIWTLLIGGLLIVALLVARGTRLRFVAALIASLIVLPALAQAAFISSGGFIWQGRYTLPLLVIALLGCGWALSDRFERLERRTFRALVIGAWIAWAFGQAYAFVSVLRRYAVGQSGSWSSVFLSPDWTPPGGAILLTALFTATVVVIAIGATRCSLGSRTAGKAIREGREHAAD